MWEHPIAPRATKGASDKSPHPLTVRRLLHPSELRFPGTLSLGARASPAYSFTSYFRRQRAFRLPSSYYVLFVGASSSPTSPIHFYLFVQSPA
eukprot:scaffold24304_cov118-Isochrysis_galbana.AAC.1